MKIHPVGAELLIVDGQMYRRTNTMKLIVTFCNFANALKYSTCMPYCFLILYPL